jgi:aminoglycoside phosphotransferase (APT) family kinase protein
MSVGSLRSLLDHLAGGTRREDGRWREWQITPIAGGRNNLLYRATSPDADLAIKFTVRDERDRAGREYGALAALRAAGLAIAPEPILLDRSGYGQPVVVQSWLEGEVTAAPPATDDEWQRLAQHLAGVHTVTPGRVQQELPWTTINANTAEEGRRRVREQADRIPAEAQPAALRALLARFEASRFPEWPPAPVTLCRLDNNITNYIRRRGPWASVDWEYSGWGDPAFDVANLLTHVTVQEAAASRRTSFAGCYCSLAADESAAVRIRVYYDILVVWWAARLARFLYEIPRGQDQRLAEWPAGWQADYEAKYERYLRLAELTYAGP